MPVASLFNPALGKHFKFGRLVSDPNSKKLHFHSYSKSLAPPPPEADWSSKSPVSMADIFENDDLGDCVIADNCRAIGIITGLNGTEYVTSTPDVTSEYGVIGGYVPGEPSTDNGCDPETALRYYSTVGYANGAKLAAWMAVDATNQTLVMQGIFELCNGAAAMNLPDAWVSPMPSADGFVWDVAGPPNPSYGHEFTIYGYTTQGLKIDTWGLKGIMTWAAAAKYLVPSAQGALYLRLFADLVGTTGVSPSGFPWAQVVSDFDAMGGTVPIPPPVTPPVPNPNPSPVPPAPAPAHWPCSSLMLLLRAILKKGSPMSAASASLTINWAALLAALENPALLAAIEAIIGAFATPASGAKHRVGDTPTSIINPNPATLGDIISNDQAWVVIQGYLTAAGVPASVLAAVAEAKATNMQLGAASVLAFQTTNPGDGEPLILTVAGIDYAVNSTATPPILEADVPLDPTTIPVVGGTPVPASKP